MSRKISWQKWTVTPESEETQEEKIVTFTPIDVLLQKFYTNNKNTLKFWGGNTNFNITKEVAAVIDKVRGVEILSIFSRYRFRIGIGHLFSSKDVREDIEVALGCSDTYLMNESVILEVRSLRLKLEKFKIPWLIYVMPNGKYEYIQEVDPVKFSEKQTNYEVIKNSIGGYLLSGV